jgi:hypothetical protein
MSMAAKGWLSRSRSSTGLIFQDDLIWSVMVQALGHPLVDISDVVPGFRYDLFLPRDTPADQILRKGLDLVHPLKNNAWAHELRQQLRL